MSVRVGYSNGTVWRGLKTSVQKYATWDNFLNITGPPQTLAERDDKWS